MKDYKKLLIKTNCNIKEALKAIDEGSLRIVFVVNNKEQIIGSVSDGDVRRWILNGGDLGQNISNVMNKNPKYINSNCTKNKAKDILHKYSINVLPIINEKNKIIDIITWEELFEDKKIKYNQIELPVVIMAGGKGTRLDPFTRILPKPLIPIGKKAMIEVIMDEYAKFGMKHFYLSINHKGKIIRAYLDDQESDYSFEYITENKPLGTAGALKHLEGKIDSAFFVSNCDIIIKDDYSKIYDFHTNGNYDLTLVASMQHHTVPYGVCEIENGGELKNIVEKPQYDFLVNAGMYLLNSDILRYIPRNQIFHITQLIDKLKKNDHKVGVYPVSEKSWIDVGQWREYFKKSKIHL